MFRWHFIFIKLFHCFTCLFLLLLLSLSLFSTATIHVAAYSYQSSFAHRIGIVKKATTKYTKPRIVTRRNGAFTNSKRLERIQMTKASTSTSTLVSSSALQASENNNDGPTWCEEQQIYIDGTIASSSHAEEHINSILLSIQQQKDEREEKTNIDSPSKTSQTQLHIFGYGSLCWNPGSSDEVLASPRVVRKVAKAVGWKRSWCQRSTDHRGDVSFPGLVCTLLSDEEILTIKRMQQKELQCDDSDGGNNGHNEEMKNDESVSMTEGVLYTIPPELVEQCLAELDFREKGGYARDVINVMVEEEEESAEPGSGPKVKESQKIIQYQKALLYRGTPDNPAFSKRALLDPNYAASIMAVAKGPSGSNDEYLFNLDEFLSTTVTTTATAAETTILQEEDDDQNKSSSSVIVGDMQTKFLASITNSFQTDYDLYFLFGTGSNQHDQLLLSPTAKDFYGDIVNAADLVNGEDAHLLNEIVLVTPKSSKGVSSIEIRPKALYAGGGHSALLTEQNDLYLWGWNEYGQLGSTDVLSSTDTNLHHSHKGMMAPVIQNLGMKVSMAALGQSHTLVIELSSGKLYCFGDNGRGKVLGFNSDDTTHQTIISTPTIPFFAKNDRFVDIAAGVFHSAAITSEGELVTFGCRRFSQSLDGSDDDKSSTVGRWRPKDGSKLVKVACGRRHTMVLDEHGRIWTMGENKKYGQLGRCRENNPDRSHVPELVDGLLGKKGSGCVDIDCGWSHSIATICKRGESPDNNDPKLALYAWGRNDKGQFGAQNRDNIPVGIDVPYLILEDINGKTVEEVACGAESVMILDNDGQIYGCGWNEHGNLATGHDKDVQGFKKLSGAKIRNFNNLPSSKVIMAAGGAHFLAAMT